MSCYHFACEPEQVRPVWHAPGRTLETRLPLSAVAVTDHPGVYCREHAARAHCAANGECYTFIVPAHADSIRLRSYHAVPAECGWLGDSRPHAGSGESAVSRCDGVLHFDVAKDDPRLTDGWWDVESDAATDVALDGR